MLHGRKPCRGLGIRHDRNSAQPEALPDSFVIPENESPVFADWTSGRTTELISLERWNRVLIKEVSGMQRAVTRELKQGAIKRIRSGFRDNVHFAHVIDGGLVGQAQQLRPAWIRVTASTHASEIVEEHILCDLLPERRSIVTRSPEVDARENAGILHFLERVRKTSERARHAH